MKDVIEAQTEAERLGAIIRGDPDLMTVLSLGRRLALPQWRLVAGCIYQTVWNALTGRPRGTGIKDYDLIYFDAADLSWTAEDRVIRRAAAAAAALATPLPAPLEIRNQARVHLWFARHFGAAYPPLAAADEAMLRYAAVVHAVGVRLEPDGRLDIAAPFGLADLFGMVLRPNPVLPNQASYDAKAARVAAQWPEAIVLPWSAGAPSAAAGGAL